MNAYKQKLNIQKTTSTIAFNSFKPKATLSNPAPEEIQDVPLTLE
jgi:hypothetical protein